MVFMLNYANADTFGKSRGWCKLFSLLPQKSKLCHMIHRCACASEVSRTKLHAFLGRLKLILLCGFELAGQYYVKKISLLMVG